MLYDAPGSPVPCALAVFPRNPGPKTRVFTLESLHQPRQEIVLVGDLLLTLTSPESKTFPTTKAKKSLTAVFRVKRGRVDDLHNHFIPLEVSLR